MDNDLLVPYRLRTVRLGVQATWLAVGSLLVVGLLRDDVPLGPYLAVLGIATAGVLGVMALPWRRLFEQGWGMRVMYVWSATDILLITALLGIVGPHNVEVFLIYGLTTVFFAASYPPRSQIALLGFTYLSYLSLLGLQGWPIGTPDLIGRLSILAVMTFLASFLSGELMRQITASADATRESERRAAMLEAVVRASRSIASLDSERVLAAVVDSAISLGFDAGGICFFDPETNTYRVLHARGLPEGFVDQPHPASMGVVSRVMESGETVVMDGYTDDPRSVPALREVGFQAVVGSPVRSQGRLIAVLTAGTRAPDAVTEDVREAFELLASTASRALENAHLYEDERRAVERLAELDRLKQDFLSTVSHEIRTPLTVIEGTGITLEQHWDVMEESMRLDFIKALNANARTLEGIITSLLDFSRLEAGRLDVNQQTVDLRASVDAAVRRLADLHKDHVLLVEVPEDAGAMADALLLDRVLENLISNAAKYSPPGSGILVAARPDGATVEVSVTDDGPGIPSEELPRLTERFFRGGDPNSRSTKGIGLGLALVREILVLHGSELHIESELGKGSRFSFSLPVRATRVDADRAVPNGSTSARP